jgi:aminopeptidase N
MNILKKTLSFTCIFFIYSSFAQTNIFTTPNTYRSTSNTHYWKNNKPYADYWQQDVHYKIIAHIDDTLDKISGSYYELTYWNNSPHTLNEMYFHVFQNAFVKGSYYENLIKNNKQPIHLGKYEAEGLGTTIENIRVNNQLVKTELDNTILKINLPQPLKSGDSVVVTLNFDTYFDTGSMRRRMKMYLTDSTKHYDGVFWYPTVCVYDKKLTWDTDQHLDKEFYHNFGTFDIALTLPQEYVVEATGHLINHSEVLPDSLRKKLDLKNFAKKPFNEKSSIITPREYGKMKTWIYHAENVHNFAFTADPLYRIGEVSWNGVRVIALAQEPHASKWQLSAWFTAQVIRVYSTDFGMYDWPKIIVADAKDGMEYPMLTLDNGTYPQHQYLLSHEVGHMWFYGMVGSNETYRAFLDEGFTQFLTVWSMDKIVGSKRQRIHRSKFVQNHLDSTNNRYDYLYNPYLNHVTDNRDEPLNTHSCAFNGAVRHGGNYGLVYYKTGTMLFNLKYILGDSLFLSAMKHYVQKWKFKHPYPEDFRDAIIEHTQIDLNWFFDEWLETTKNINYSIQRVKQKKENDIYINRISLERKGRMHMPIRLTCTYENGNNKSYYIPNTWYSPNDSSIKLPKWYGWDLLQPNYTFTDTSVSKLKQIKIDSEELLADYDLTNNLWKKKGFSTWQFDHRVPSYKQWTVQRNYWRPDIWYNGFDGVQVGLHINGSYFNKYKYGVTAWGNTRLGQNLYTDNGTSPTYFSFQAKYQRSLNMISRDLSNSYYLSYYGGITRIQTGLEKLFKKQDRTNPNYFKAFTNINYLINEKSTYNYLLYPSDYGVGDGNSEKVNSFIQFGFTQYYQYNKGKGEYTFQIRTPFVGSNYNYSQLTLESKNTCKEINKIDIRSRLFSQIGLQNIPYESALYAGGANTEQLIQNRLTRAIGWVPYEWLNYSTSANHFQFGGGLNLRGYAGNLLAETHKDNSGIDTIVYAYRGNSGASWNLEIELDQLTPLKAKGITKNIHLDYYFLTDIGIMRFQALNQYYWSKIYIDAGFGLASTIKFSPYDINPLIIRADFPVYINQPGTQENNFEFRYVLSVQRSF